MTYSTLCVKNSGPLVSRRVGFKMVGWVRGFRKPGVVRVMGASTAFRIWKKLAPLIENDGSWGPRRRGILSWDMFVRRYLGKRGIAVSGAIR